MKFLKIGAISVVSALVLSACAAPGKTGWYDQWGACAAAGAAVGIAGGATDDFEAAVGVGAGGFVIGGAICAMGDTDADGVKNYKDDCRGTAPGGIVDARGCEIDSDGDGVVDRLDECPGTVAGARVDARGCEVDSDGDGVPDSRDRCAGTKAGAKVNQYGCEMDADGDGVVDGMDKCANTPKGVPVDNNGCELEKEYELHGVNFEFDSAKLMGSSTAVLNDAAKILKRKDGLRVVVAGHTDSRGNDNYNMGLSQRRAQAVADYLVSRGVNASHLTVKGFGETQPVADNSTEAGRAANRRVELRH